LEGKASGSEPNEPVVGYGGLWKIVDETHISTIAVAPELRGRGIGELLLLAMMDVSQELAAKLVTLEVRKSNMTAQALYRKYRFEIVGERKHYYSDNGEDAWIMTTPEITTASFNAGLEELRAVLYARLAS
jgi:ribosomal-protein-alanine N-acetyltransferase